MPTQKCKPLPPLSQSDIDRFWLKVDSRSGPEACWLWSGSITGSGYGEFSITTANGKRQVAAHRIAYSLGYGVDPFPLLVCHSCDVPLCCNPKHLFKGTDSDNVADMVKKNRPFGCQRKVTTEQVSLMRLMADEGSSFTSLGALFGINRRTVGAIVNNKSRINS